MRELADIGETVIMSTLERPNSKCLKEMRREARVAAGRNPIHVLLGPIK